MREREDAARYKAFTRRALLLGGGQLALVGALAARMYYLQVTEADQYRVLADENRINMRLLAPPRGRVLDRFGVEVATNRQNFRVVLIPEQTNGVGQTLDRLAEVIPIGEHERKRVLREARRTRGFVPIPVVDNLTWEEFARVNVYSPELPGIQMDVGETRDYPYGDILAHVVGYVGAVSESDLRGDDPDPLLELPGFRIGKSGVERSYDLALRGKAGSSRVEVNAFGRVIRELTRNDGQPGADLVLTLDGSLQSFALERFGQESGAAVVIGVHSGDVLAMVSAPSFDPNAFTVGLSSAEWHRLIRNPRKPLDNKAVMGQYPPGSTFKMIVALAALEHGLVGPGHEVTCRGWVQLGTSRFHCWKRYGHGRLNMIQAITQSCDVYFYDLARRLGVDRIAAMAQRFGLGQNLLRDLPGVRSGLIPTSDWKLAVKGVPWQKGEDLITGIGQGYVLATPLQLALMTARIANGGKAVVPRLVRQTGEVDDGDQAADAATEVALLGINPASLAVVRKGMNLVVNGRHGTARGARIEREDWRLAGKTGTSQVRRISRAERASRVLKNKERPWEERDHALFVAFAPVDAPRYAVAVVVEHGGSGSRAAAPVARDIMAETLRLDPVRRPGRGRFAAWPAGHGAKTRPRGA